MDSKLEVIATAKIHNNRRIRLPPAIRENVVTNDTFKGEIVYWNYHSVTQVMLVSEVPLSQPEYESPGASKLHKHQNTVTPPKELVDVIASEAVEFGGEELFESGETVVYLANTHIIEHEYKNYFLMSRQRFLDLIEEDPNDEEAIGPVLGTLLPR